MKDGYKKIKIELTSDMYEAIQKLAEEHKLSMEDMIIKILKDYIENYNQLNSQ